MTSLGDKYEREILTTIQGEKERVEKVMAEMHFSVDSITVAYSDHNITYSFSLFWFKKTHIQENWVLFLYFYLTTAYDNMGSVFS